jgi:SAM-dependent methyltransferase
MSDWIRGQDSDKLEIEFTRLKNLGWEIPSFKSFGLITPSMIDESTISFPSKIWEESTINQDVTEFWATARAHSIADILQVTNTNILWEIGAGNGSVAIPLKNSGFTVIPVEPLKSGALILSEKGFMTFWSTLENLEFPDNSIEAIGAFDVLEHLQEPKLFLDEVYRVLTPGGYFICSVPAYNWLFSDFDISLGHFRRYSGKSLKKIAINSGLTPIKLKYLFAFLIIPAFILRRVPYLLGIRRYSLKIVSINKHQNRIITKLQVVLKFILLIEKKLNTKFGLSIILLTVKK